MKEQELTISILATDRHASIAKMMRTTYPEIDHKYDVWHMAKRIAKKLCKKNG
jgi:HD superfamily phosphodiesterase